MSYVIEGGKLTFPALMTYLPHVLTNFLVISSTDSCLMLFPVPYYCFLSLVDLPKFCTCGLVCFTTYLQYLDSENSFEDIFQPNSSPD